MREVVVVNVCISRRTYANGIIVCFFFLVMYKLIFGSESDITGY